MKQLTMYYLHAHTHIQSGDVPISHASSYYNHLVSLKKIYKCYWSFIGHLTLSLEFRLLSFWLCWHIWKSRNEFIFNKQNVAPIEDVERSLSVAKEWIEVFNLSESEYLTHRRPPRQDSDWEPPPEGWVKCNFDSSFRNDMEDIGVGWIILDSTGHHIVSGCARLPPVINALQAEAKGFMHVLQTLWI